MGQDKIEQLYYVMYVCMRSRTCQRRAHPPLGGSEAMYLLQTQPMFMVELAKAIDIVSPAPVEVLRSIHASLEDSPSTALQVAPHVECLPTAGVYGVHTGLPASSVVDVLAAGGGGAGVCAGTWGSGGAAYGGTVLCRMCCLREFCTCCI